MKVRREKTNSISQTGKYLMKCVTETKNFDLIKNLRFYNYGCFMKWNTSVSSHRITNDVLLHGCALPRSKIFS